MILEQSIDRLEKGGKITKAKADEVRANKKFKDAKAKLKQDVKAVEEGQGSLRSLSK